MNASLPRFTASVGFLLPAVLAVFALQITTQILKAQVGTDNSLVVLDKTTRELIDANTEAAALFKSAPEELAPDAIPAFAQINVPAKLLSSDEMRRLESALQTLEETHRLVAKVVLSKSSDLALNAARLAAYTAKLGNTESTVGVLFDHTGNQRLLAFSALARTKLGGRSVIDQAAAAARAALRKGQTPGEAATRYIEALDSAFSNVRQADLEIGAPTISPGIEKSERTRQNASDAPSGAAAGSSGNLSGADTEAANESYLGGERDASAQPGAASRGRSPASSGFKLDSGMKLIIATTGLLLFPIVWSAVSQTMKRIRRAKRARSRYAELATQIQKTGPQSPSVTIPSRIKSDTGSVPTDRQPFPHGSDAGSTGLRPKALTREAAPITPVPRVFGDPEVVDDTGAVDVALRYVRAAREAPDEIRADLLVRLERHLVAMREQQLPVVVRPQRRFEQEPVEHT